MTELTIKLWDADYQRLERMAEQSGKSIDTLVREWISQLPVNTETYDVRQDPVFTMEGCNAGGPEDLSANIDAYIYRGKPAE